MKLLFEKHHAGSNDFCFPLDDLEPGTETIPTEHFNTGALDFPELSEVETVRHFTALSKRAFGVDDGTYPLGSCTMKYNPKVNEWGANLPGFAAVHPYQYDQAFGATGAMELMAELESMLCDIAGMDAFSLQPAAGAHGELAGMMMIRAYHRDRGEDATRRVVLVPDSAHGTNPATAAMIGYRVREVKSGPDGLVDLADLAAQCGDDIAGLMLTNPNTLGLFERNIEEMARLVHECGGLLYYDGANLNAIAGVARPGDMGFDVVHFNLHKTFSTPHGGGGPGSGPVGVKKILEPFLPTPVLRPCDDTHEWRFDVDRPKSIGRVKTFYGNFGVCVKAYAYLKGLGTDGVKNASQLAVLNANYLRKKLGEDYEIPFDQICMHEFVATNARQKEFGVRTLDIAKRLIDFGVHPPTIYFPLIVQEAMMFEPTETESRERLDALAAVMKRIAHESATTPEVVTNAPQSTPIGRPDETRAARTPILKFSSET